MTDIWNRTLEAIRPRLSEHVFRTYFEPMHCVGETEAALTLALPSKFIRDWVLDHYRGFLVEQVSEVAGRPLEVEVVVEPSLAKPAATATAEPEAPQGTARRPFVKTRKLNEKYTFENFVAGASNQFAYAACKAAAEKPAEAYNPLFLFGGVGLGKTHLLHAIGLEIRRQHPDWNILLLSAEQFTNEVIVGIRDGQMDALRAKYRDHCDVLLMDDIQFLAGKDRTQEEFFHTFNNLYETKRQIVVTSDKFPNEIPELEERLSSRFQWGLIADIQPPELETRVAILEKKARLDGIALPDEVAMFLATHVKSNVRELEGALIRVEAFASLTGQEITLELAKEVLKDVINLHGRRPDAEHILRTVASFYNVKVSDLRGQRRHKQIALPRQVAMYLTRKLTDLSFPEIGRTFGGKDHSTVMSACKKIERLVEQDHDLRQVLESLEKNLAT
ncbi:MAG: chromosomal replication initiator protein DnaA [Deltaproteobacteria bacterium]|nr:MAG: chromosomal replication initiator protein DnaA [Deltaproteobacteria bacterium]